MGGDDEDSVEDYMSKLLGRMRGDSEPAVAKPAAEKQVEKPAEPVEQSPAIIAAELEEKPAVVAKLHTRRVYPQAKGCSYAVARIVT